MTALDALGCKSSIVDLGYISDEYLKYFYQKKLRKPPIINRGYFARVACVSKLVESFLSRTTSRERQIIILGSGFDTLSFNLIQNNHESLSIVEVDFHDIIEKKCRIVLTESNLTKLLTPNQSLTLEESRIQSGYKCGPVSFVSVDLRDSKSLLDTFERLSLNRSLPTLVLTECVLVYLEKQATEALLDTIATYFEQAVWVSYDMCNCQDPFGRVMLGNLREAGHRVPGLINYSTLLSHKERFISKGWKDCSVCTMLQAYNNPTYINADTKKRISSLELFDEIEEWELIMSHYCLSVAVKGGNDSSSDHFSSLLGLSIF